MTRQIRAWPRRTRDGATLACPRARCPPLCRFPLRRLSAVALRPPLPSVTFEISPQRGLQAADISRKNHMERRLTCCAAVRPSPPKARSCSISEVLPRTGARGADSPRVPRRLPVPSALVRPSSSSFHAPSRRPRAGMRELRASRTRSLPAARLQAAPRAHAPVAGPAQSPAGGVAMRAVAGRRVCARASRTHAFRCAAGLSFSGQVLRTGAVRQARGR